MGRVTGWRVLSLGVLLIGLVVLPGQSAKAGDRNKVPPIGQGTAPTTSTGTTYVLPYFFPSFGHFGFYGGYYSPFISVPTLPPAYPYLPKYWWTGPYPENDPRQSGYNPAAGYSKDQVTTLLLMTYPLKTRIILDGIYVGTSDRLGPIQLPLGEHILRVEAVGFEPSETVLKVEQPTLQQLEVRLKPAAPSAKAEPRP